MFTRFVPLILACLAARGQTFEAASIKPATPLGPLGMRTDRKGGPGTSDPGMFHCLNCPLAWVVTDAYNVPSFEFFAPGWVQSTRFDFSVKLPAGTTKEDFRLMLENLLTERFKLAVHREKRQMRVYDLTVAKSGPKFKEAVPKDQPQGDEPAGKLKRDDDGFPILTPGMTMAAIPGHARMRSDNQPVTWLTEMLSGQLQCPVIDSTGLKGKYDFMVSWAWEESHGGDASAAEVNPYLPSLIDAVQTQLGLKLEQKNGQAEVLVVDHMEKVPTGN